MDVRLEERLLALLHDVIVDLGAGLVVGLLDPGWVDASVRSLAITLEGESPAQAPALMQSAAVPATCGEAMLVPLLGISS